MGALLEPRREAPLVLYAQNMLGFKGGEVLILPPSAAPVLTDKSDIVIVFAATDKALVGRFPPAVKPM